MSLPDIRVFSRVACGRFLTLGEEKTACLVSIGDPWVPPPAGYERVDRRLRLLFEDVDYEGPGIVAPSAADVASIIEFAAIIGRAGGTTAIHCEAGISRSTAATYITFATLLGEGREEDALDATLRAAPQARPNRRMVRFADDGLGRGGLLIGTLEERIY